MDPGHSSARVVVPLLIAGKRRQGQSVDDVQPVADALGSTLVELARWLGPDGSRAILERALSQASSDYPALADLKIISNSAPAVVGVAEAVQAHGSKLIAAALTTTMVRLFELLERMIGNDLTMNLAKQITNAELSAPIREEEQ
jgi:hypothetical protein